MITIPISFFKQHSSPNLYTLANAANPTPNEVDATTGTANDNANSSWSSANTPLTAYNGSYYLSLNVDVSSVSIIATIILSDITIGDTYQVSFWAKRAETAGNWTFGLETYHGWLEQSTIALGSSLNDWYEVILTGEATSTTPEIRIFSSSSTAGRTLGVDNIIITKI